MKKVLVMGGTYFIGKAITHELLLCGYDVYTLNRGTTVPADQRITQITCDRNNHENMKKALGSYSFDCVVDVSAVQKKQSEILLDSLNFNHLSEYIFISSSAVYAVKQLNIPFAETDKLGDNAYWGQYGIDKIQSEQFLTERLGNTNISLNILRPPYVYGENNYAQRESFVFNRIYNDKPVVVPNKGTGMLQFIYAPDLANIVATLLDKSLSGVNIFNVGNSKGITTSQWVQACGKATGKAVKILTYDYEGDGKNVRDFFPFFDYDNVLEVSKIKTLVPNETDFLLGLNNAYRWYLRNVDNIKFKDYVEDNLYEIVEKLTKC